MCFTGMRGAELTMSIPGLQIETLNPAVVNFGVSQARLPAFDARHQWHRRSNLLQAIDNEADSVKLATPQGKKNEKKYLIRHSPKR